MIKYTTRARMNVSMAQGVGTFNCHRRFHMAMQRGANHCAAAQRTAQHTLELLWRTSSTSIAHLSAKAERRPPLRCGAAARGLTPSSSISEARPQCALGGPTPSSGISEAQPCCAFGGPTPSSAVPLGAVHQAAASQRRGHAVPFGALRRAAACLPRQEFQKTGQMD